MFTLKEKVASLGGGWVQKLTANGTLDNGRGSKFFTYVMDLPKPAVNEDITVRTCPVIEVEMSFSQTYTTEVVEGRNQRSFRLFGNLQSFVDTGETVSEQLFGKTRQVVMSIVESEKARAKDVIKVPKKVTVKKQKTTSNAEVDSVV